MSRWSLAIASPSSSVSPVKLANGRWAYMLVFRGVTYPAQGAFGSQLEAMAAGAAAIKSLEKKG